MTDTTIDYRPTKGDLRFALTREVERIANDPLRAEARRVLSLKLEFRM
jgi:hypothetical protein